MTAGVPYAEVIGDPVAHSKSPLIHKFWLEKLGIEGDYRALRVPADGLQAYFEARRSDPAWRGCNVTLPHKERIRPLVEEARLYATDAINCVVPRDGRLVGFNTDMSGIGNAIGGIDTWAPVCIIGSGGAASATIADMDILAVYQFNLIARNRERALALVAAYGEHGKVFSFEQAAEAMDDCLALINASPLGMQGFEPMPESVLAALGGLRKDEAFVLDMVYAPPRTELLRRAEERGLTTIDGLTMLVGQAREAFALFFGAEAPREHDAALRERLTR
jgi:shikimate dehydrogenase